MIKRLYVDNYTSLVNFELRLSELTLLIGRNGSGKTSVLNVVHALRRLLSGEVKITDPDAFPTRTLTRWQAREKQTFEVDCTLGNDDFVYRLELAHERSTRRAKVARETLECAGKPLFAFVDGIVTLYRDDHSKGPNFRSDWTESALARVQPGQDNTRLTQFLEHMKRIIVCGLYPASFAAESTDEEPMLTRDAANFAAWYRHLMLDRPDLVHEFTSALAPIIDEFHSIRMERIGLDARALMVVFEHQDQKYELRLNELSDGQRALIALYALIKLTAGQGYTLFLDEPDNYISLAEIQPWLIEVAETCGPGITQTILCSHHPELIDYLGAEHGVLLHRESAGVTNAKPVSEVAIESPLRLSERTARGDLE